MTWVIRELRLAGSVEFEPERYAPPARPTYVASYDPDAYGGRGTVTWTEDPNLARQFSSRLEAFVFIRQPSSQRPRRADGQPNRPLTAFSLVVEPFPEESSS